MYLLDIFFLDLASYEFPLYLNLIVIFIFVRLGAWIYNYVHAQLRKGQSKNQWRSGYLDQHPRQSPRRTRYMYIV